jgi:hypothetical protein
MGLGMPFLNNDTCARGRGLFNYARVFFPCMTWMDDGTNGWMDESHEKNFTKNDHDIFYYTLEPL